LTNNRIKASFYYTEGGNNMSKRYQAAILNVDKNKWIRDEEHGIVKYAKNESDRIIFYEEEDAESTVDLLNENESDCFTLVIL
jgi:hypothetical protein